MSLVKPSNAVMIQGRSGQIALVNDSGSAHVVITAHTASTLTLTTTFILSSSGSGGVALTSATSSYPYGVTVKNASNVVGVSGVILLGTSGSPPYISGGYPLHVGESITLNVSRPDFIRVYGTLSGVAAGWIGELG